MKRAGIILQVLLWLGCFVDGADAAWLLWRHSLVTQRIEGMPRGISPSGNVEKWELLNAVELRKECIAALRIEHKKSYDNLASVYPNEPISQSIVADGISASVSAGAERSGAPATRTTQLYYEYTFWCLPGEVDPKWVKPLPERNIFAK